MSNPSSPRQVHDRVDNFSANQHFEMKLRTGDKARRSKQTDDVTRFDACPNDHGHSLQMAVGRRKMRSMSDHNLVAVLTVVLGQFHNARRTSMNRRSLRADIVEAGMPPIAVEQWV